jgi:preprotein translocase subunit SecG
MGDFLRTPITVVHILACLFLILVILIQPGKSGGLGALGGGGAQQVFGGSGAGNFLTKTTWATAAIFFLTSITLAYLSSSSDESLQKRASQLSRRHESGQATPSLSKTPAKPASSK